MGKQSQAEKGMGTTPRQKEIRVTPAVIKLRRANLLVEVMVSIPGVC